MIITKHDSVITDSDFYYNENLVGLERKKRNTYIKVNDTKQRGEMEKALFILIFLCKETNAEIHITKSELLEISTWSGIIPTEFKLKKFLEKKYPSLLDIIKNIEMKRYIKKEQLRFDHMEDFPNKTNIYFHSNMLNTVPLMAIYDKKEKRFRKLQIHTGDQCVKVALSSFEEDVFWIPEDELSRYYLDGYRTKFYCFKDEYIKKEIRKFLGSNPGIQMKLLFVK